MPFFDVPSGNITFTGLRCGAGGKSGKSATLPLLSSLLLLVIACGRRRAPGLRFLCEIITIIITIKHTNAAEMPTARRTLASILWLSGTEMH